MGENILTPCINKGYNKLTRLNNKTNPSEKKKRVTELNKRFSKDIQMDKTYMTKLIIKELHIKIAMR